MNFLRDTNDFTKPRRQPPELIERQREEESRGRVPFYVQYTRSTRMPGREDSEAEAECWKPGRVVSLLASLCDTVVAEGRTSRCNFADNGGINYLPVVEKGKRTEAGSKIHVALLY